MGSRSLGRSLAERFWEKVKKGRGCWVWQASVFQSGYGQISDSTSGKRKNRRSNRVAWELTNGPILDDLHVLHHCDNRLCCNPKHLFLGTVQDNMRDRNVKGREAHGEWNGMARLTNKKVRWIRRVYPKETACALATRFGVSRSTIYHVLSRESWRHVD